MCATDADLETFWLNHAEAREIHADIAQASLRKILKTNALRDFRDLRIAKLKRCSIDESIGMTAPSQPLASHLPCATRFFGSRLKASHQSARSAKISCYGSDYHSLSQAAIAP